MFARNALKYHLAPVAYPTQVALSFSLLSTVGVLDIQIDGWA